MSKPPQLAHFNKKEQWLYSDLPLVSKLLTRHYSLRKVIFAACICSHLFITTQGSWPQLVLEHSFSYRELSILTQLNFQHAGPKTYPGFSSCTSIMEEAHKGRTSSSYLSITCPPKAHQSLYSIGRLQKGNQKHWKLKDQSTSFQQSRTRVPTIAT